MLVILLTLIILVLCLLDLSVRYSRVWRMLSSQFPGETPLPLVGNMLQLGFGPEDVQRNTEILWRKYNKKNFRLMLGTLPIFYVCEADTAKTIMSSSEHIDKADMQVEAMTEHFPDSLVISKGDRWRVMRKLITPTLHFTLLEHYFKYSIEEGNILVEKIRKHATGGEAVDVHELLEDYTINLICRAGMGVDTKNHEDIYRNYARASKQLIPLYCERFFSIWKRNDFIYKRSSLSKEGREIGEIMYKAVDKLIRDRMEIFEKNIKPLMSSNESVEDFIAKNRTDLTMIDVLFLSKMPDGSSIPLDKIRGEINVLVFAGYDTTLTALSFALSNFARYQDLQEKAYQEQLEIFGDDLSREATYKDLNKMKYLQQFIKENLRLYPVGTNFTRKIRTDVQLPDGKVLPAGTQLMFYLPGIHRNPEYFANPDTFDPDRFLEPVPAFTFLSFSAGPRNCIGMNFAWMSMRSVLSKILRHYHVSLQSPDHEVQPVCKIILTSKNGFKVKFTERS